MVGALEALFLDIDAHWLMLGLFLLRSGIRSQRRVHQRVDGPQATELAPEGGGPGRVFISGWTKESSEGVLALFLMLEGMARWWPVVGG